jgi:hypothetical protein
MSLSVFAFSDNKLMSRAEKLDTTSPSQMNRLSTRKYQYSGLPSVKVYDTLEPEQASMIFTPMATPLSSR